MKTTQNISKPLRNHLKPLALALTAGCLLGLSVSTNAVAASITYFGTDTTTKGDWRTTSVAKPSDLSGDNAYGSDGWMRAQKNPAWPNPPGVLANPSYATLAFDPAVQQTEAENAVYNGAIDQPLAPAASVADCQSVVGYLWNSPNVNMATITMTAAKSFRLSILYNARTDAATYGTNGVGVKGPGGLDVYQAHAKVTAKDWAQFDITGAPGDVFTIYFTTNGQEKDLSVIALDSISSVPVASAASADWNITTTWDTLTVPTATSAVTVTHAVTIDSAVSTTPANCYSLALSGGGSVAATNQSLTVASPLSGALNTTGGGTLALDVTSTLTIPNATTSASLVNLTVGSGTILNVTGELTVDATKDLTGAILNTPKVTLAGGSTLTVGALNVPSAGYLTGTGTVAGAVAVAGGGKVAPGTDTTIATLATNSLSLANGSLLTINADSTSNNDQITVSTSDSLTINGGAVTFLDGTGSGPVTANGTYNLIAYSGAIGGTGVSSLTVTNPAAGKLYSFGTSGGYVTLKVSQGFVVPLLSQNFDTDPVNYAVTGAQAVGSNYFALSNAAGITLNPNLTGASGVYFTMQAPATNPCQLTFNPVSMAGFTSPTLSISLAGAAAVEADNYLRLLADTNGDGTYETTIFNFAGTGNNTAYKDSSALNLGVLSAAFNTFTGIPMPVGDGTLRLRIETWSNSTTNENNGFDSIIVSGTTAPTPSAGNGDWHTPATWTSLSVPTANTPVQVDTHTVTITTATANCNSLALSGSGSIWAAGQSLTVANTGIDALSTTGGTLNLDASSTLNIAKANTSASLAGLTVGSGTILNVTNELTVDASKDLTGATLNTPKVTLAGGTLTIGAVTVPSGGLISGTGTVAGAVTVAGGGKVSPGASVGSFTVDGLALSAGSLLDFEFNTTPANDQITVSTSGGLTINGGAISLYNEGGTTTFSTAGTYNLFGYSGSIGGAGVSSLTVANKVAGKQYTFGATGTYVTLTIDQGASWNGGGTTADWSEALNWSGVSPSTGDILPFVAVGAGGATLNNNLTGGSYASLQFESGAPAFTLNGNAVTLTGDASGNVVLNNSSNTQTVNMPVTLGNNGAINTASNPVVFGSAATIDNNGKILTVMGTQPVTLNGAMTGIGGVTLTTGKLLYLGADGAVSGTLTLNGGTIDNKKGSLLTLTNNPAQAWGGSFTFAGTDNMNMGTGAVTLGANLTATINNAKTLTVGGPITGAFTLTKAGSGNLVISSAGSSLTKMTFTGDPGGTVVIDDSVVASPSLTFTGYSDIDNGSRNLLIIKNATVNMGGYKMQGGQMVVEGTSTVTITAGDLTMGNRDGRRASLYVKNTAQINGTSRDLYIGAGWTEQANYVRLQDSAQATFNRVDVLREAKYTNGHGHGALLELSESAQLTGAADMYVLTVADRGGRTNGTIYAYSQVYQHGSGSGTTVTVGGNIRMADNVSEPSGTLIYKVQAAYNLCAASTLNLGGRILGGASRTGSGQSLFNFHGGTLAYKGAGDQADWINLTVTAGDAGTTSANNLRVWEGATIDTGGSDGLGRNLTIIQAILAPTGKGISAIDPAGLGTPAAVYDYNTPPWVYIDGGGGSGATAVAVLNASGVVTSIVVTNPGNGYTSAPTVQLVRNGVSDNTVAAGSITLTDNAYTGGLTKQGLGTLTLTGANTYTGATAVSQGTLALVGGSQKSPITVSPSASLAFDIASPTASTSTYNLSAGTIKIIGTPTLNSYILTTSSGITGTPTMHAPIGGYGLTVDGTTLKLVKSGYASWAGANSISLIPSEDTNNDGVANGVAYFMNKTGLATNPAINGTTKKVTWPNGGNINSDQYGIQFVVQISTDLQTWTDVLDTDPNLINTPAVVFPPADGELSYTLKDPSPSFARLKVTPN
jgi:autotransporter-associated beta strand protein